MSDIVERLRGVYRVAIKDGLGPVGAGEEPDNPDAFVRHFETPPIQHEAADLITSLRAELERKDAALRTVGEGDVPRPIGTYYREDKTPSKNDQCIHGLWMYEECGQCIEAFCRAALSAQKEE